MDQYVIPERLEDMEPFYIFMLGVLSTYPPYNQMTPDETLANLKKSFVDANPQPKHWTGR